MLIRNTDIEAVYPWPDGTFIQGGASGVVLRRSGGAYTTAFVEVSGAGTFIRGEGATVAEAEQACWAKFQRVVGCDGNGPHGPFEARGYENGAGFCTRCGSWFPGVLPKSPDVQAEDDACAAVIARYGQEVPGSRWWGDLVSDEVARIVAARDGLPSPNLPSRVSDEEYATWVSERHSAPEGAFVSALEALLGATDADEDDDTARA